MNLKMLFVLSIAILLIGHFPADAQSAKVTFSGVVLDAKNGETMPAVVVNIKELNLWATSDLDGKFRFKNVTPGTYTILASCLGYEDYSFKVVLTKSVENYKLKLSEQSLALDEVIVTAKEGGKLNSSSSINKTAIDHLQGASLTDVMQLLPGSVTTNPTLTAVNKISIRDISGKDDANVLGTAVILDGAKLSNDANLQQKSDVNAFATTSGTGIDARQIPVDNVESVEVIRGVASAEYGDMTSGAVIVKTKAGKTPFDVRFKADPNTKQFSAGKGISLGQRKGFLNIDADYARAFNDTRTPAKSFDRVTAQIGYSNIFNTEGRAISFNAKLRGFLIQDKYKQDPDQIKDELYKSEDQQISLNVYGNWMIEKPWLTNLNYNISGSYGKQYNREKVWRTPGRIPSTSSMETGEHIATLLPYEYFSDLVIEGKPVYVNAKLTANIAGKYGNIYNKFLLGGEWTTKGNNGNGKTFDAEYTPSQNMRPRSFKDIPFIHEYTGFIEDKVTITMNKKSLELSAGARFTNIETEAVDYKVAIDPRFNARFVLLDNKWKKKGIQYVSIRAGWGILHKMPGLAYLYPENSYVDKSSFSYNDEENNYSLGVMTTKVTETGNPDLKLPKSTNIEIGVDLKLWGITANLAYFNEKLRDGFSFAGTSRSFYYRDYAHITEEGKRPEHVNGVVEVDGKPVDYTVRGTFANYQRPSNGISVDKWGFEYSLDFGKISAIQTSVIVDGAYFNYKSLENDLQTFYETSSFGSIKDYPFVCLYAGNGTSSGTNGTKSQRLNTDIRLVTHLPKLRLIFTLTGQCVWLDKTQRLAEYQGKSLLYYRDKDKNIVDGSKPEEIAAICVDPIAYMDLDGVVRPFTDVERQNPDFDRSIRTSRPEFFSTDSQDPYFLLNMRLTKEIGRIASLSFYANNFTNSRPKRYFRSGGYYMRLNTEMSFGAELRLKF